MLDIDFIRKNKELVQEGADKKGFDVDIGELLEVDEKRRKLKQEVDEGRRENNEISEKVKKSESEQERKKLIEEAREIKEELAKKEDEFKEVKKRWKEIMLEVPNVPDPEAPVGEDEEANKSLKEWGEKPNFGFDPKDHLELGEELDIIDFKRGAKVAGNNFYYLKNEGAALQWALMSMAIDKVREKGFSFMIVPDLVKEEAMQGTGFFPAEEREIYQLKKDDLYLIGTSEVPLASYRSEEILSEDELPQKYAGFSACFRREAGAYGKKSKGIYRAHQFHKVEMVVACKPHQADDIFDELLMNSEEIMQELKLPYRVVFNCTGDMGFPQRKKYDLETWMAGRGEYGETHSCSFDTDFQARRLGIRFRNNEDETQFVYTLNNTVVTERIIIALLENNQTESGSVRIPDKLADYCGFKEIKPV